MRNLGKLAVVAVLLAGGGPDGKLVPLIQVPLPEGAAGQGAAEIVFAKDGDHVLELLPVSDAEEVPVVLRCCVPPPPFGKEADGRPSKRRLPP